MKNDDENNTENINNYLVTIDEIEERTGIDFFSEVNDKDENKIESEILIKY